MNQAVNMNEIVRDYFRQRGTNISTTQVLRLMAAKKMNISPSNIRKMRRQVEGELGTKTPPVGDYARKGDDRRQELPKGEKKRMVKEALERFGPQVTWSMANKWLMDKYGKGVSSQYFQSLRYRKLHGGRDYGNRGEKTVVTPSPSIAQINGQKVEQTNLNGVAALVSYAKQLVDKVGKEEAKRLIDAL